MSIRYLSGINVDGGTLVVDDVNNRVGIGTASPDSKLVVSGSGQVTAKVESTNNQANVFLQGTFGQFENLAGDLYITNNAASSPIVFRAGLALERMRITSAGNVGIGTTSVDAKLFVQSSVSSTEPTMFVQSGTGAGQYGMISTGDSFHGLIMRGSPSAATTYGVTAGDEMSFFEYGGIFNFYKKDNIGPTLNLFARISSNSATYFNGGNVGIGTTAPGSKLTVIDSNNTTPLTIGAGSNATFEFKGNSTSGYTSTFNINDTALYIGHNSASRNLVFQTHSTDRLTIAGSGAATFSSSVTASSLIKSGGTASQYLMADGSVSTLTNPVTGTGTTNYIPKFTSASAIGNSQIFDDGTSVGIGTAIPTDKLTIQGTSLKFYTTQNVANQYTYIGTEYSAGNGNNKAEIRFAIDGTDTRTRMQFHTANGGGDIGERMRITYDGNVGIGTTAPNSKLDVRGVIEGGDGTIRTVVSYTGSGGVTGTITNHPYILYANNDERMRITAAGNVGIGTTAPSGKLHVYNASGPSIIYNETYNGIQSYWNSSDGSIVYFGSTSNHPLGFISNNTERMRITAAGNVGIGTTSPGDKLTVSGGITGDTLTLNSGAGINVTSYGFLSQTVSGQMTFLGHNVRASTSTANTALVVNSGWYSSLIKMYYSDGITFHTSATSYTAGDVFPLSTTERMRIRANGSILFNAYGAGSITGTAAYGLAVDSSGNVIEVTSTVDGSGTANYVTKWQDSNTLTNSIIYDNGTNVGIGTTSPSAKLDVSVSSGAAWMNLINASESAFRLTTYNNGTGSGTSVYAFKHGLYYNGTENTAVTFYRGGSSVGGFLTFTTNDGTERMRIDASGNVGIGTTSPVSTNLSGSLTIYKSYNGDTASVPSITAQTYYENQSGLYLFGRNSGLTLVGANGENNEIVFANASSRGYAKIGTTNGTTASGGDMYFSTGGNVETMRITSLNNVLIGTTANAGYKLDVSGSFRTVGNSSVLSNYGNGSTQIYTYQIATGTSVSDNQVFDLYLGRFGNGYHKVVLWSQGYGTDSGNYFDITRSWGTSSTPRIVTNGGLKVGAATYSIHWAQVGNGQYDLFIKWYSGMPTGYSNVINYSIQSNTGAGYTQFEYPSVTVPTLNNNNLVNSVITAKYDNGDVGIGTTSPSEKLHVDGNVIVTYNNSFQGINSIGNKAILARVSPTSGIINYAEYATAANLNGFVIGSDDARVKGNIATDSLEFITNGSTRAFIDSSGNVGINTTSPSYKLDVVGDARITSGSLGVGVAPNATDGRIDASNDIVAYSTSDQRLKENVTPIENALEKVKTLTGVEFDWKEETAHVHGYHGHDVGIIAQDVQAVLPEAVRTNDSGYLSVRYEKMIALLIEANKELAARVEELEKKLK